MGRRRPTGLKHLKVPMQVPVRKVLVAVEAPGLSPPTCGAPLGRRNECLSLASTRATAHAKMESFWRGAHHASKWGPPSASSGVYTAWCMRIQLSSSGHVGSTAWLLAKAL